MFALADQRDPDSLLGMSNLVGAGKLGMQFDLGESADWKLLPEWETDDDRASNGFGHATDTTSKLLHEKSVPFMRVGEVVVSRELQRLPSSLSASSLYSSVLSSPPNAAFDEEQLRDYAGDCQNMAVAQQGRMDDPDVCDDLVPMPGSDWVDVDEHHNADAGPVSEPPPKRRRRASASASAEKIFCETCGEACLHKDAQEKPYVCQGCRSMFRDPCAIAKVIGKNDEAKPFVCKTCGKAFPHSRGLAEHHFTHLTETECSCETCGKTFIGHRKLAKHVLTHSRQRPTHRCATCGKCFTQAGSLKTHIRTHTGERPYKCKTCGKAFTQSMHLTEHTRTHTKEKPYKCTVCIKGFARSDHLMIHMRTHTGEQPFSCQTCGKAFTTSGNLVTHMRTHTGEKPHSCLHCGKAFTTVCNMRQHMRTHVEFADTAT